MQDNPAFPASIYVIYVVLRVFLYDLYSRITASRVVGPTGTPSGSCTGTLRMFDDPNWVSPIGICGKGDGRIYPLDRLPTHPCRALGDDALGKTLGDLFLCRSHERTSI